MAVHNAKAKAGSIPAKGGVMASPIIRNMAISSMPTDPPSHRDDGHRASSTDRPRRSQAVATA